MDRIQAIEREQRRLRRELRENFPDRFQVDPEVDTSLDIIAFVRCAETMQNSYYEADEDDLDTSLGELPDIDEFEADVTDEQEEILEEKIKDIYKNIYDELLERAHQRIRDYNREFPSDSGSEASGSHDGSQDGSEDGSQDGSASTASYYTANGSVHSSELHSVNSNDGSNSVTSKRSYDEGSTDNDDGHKHKKQKGQGQSKPLFWETARSLCRLNGYDFDPKKTYYEHDFPSLQH
jgi:hypothetical protein